MMIKNILKWFRREPKELTQQWYEDQLTRALVRGNDFAIKEAFNKLHDFLVEKQIIDDAMKHYHHEKQMVDAAMKNYYYLKAMKLLGKRDEQTTNCIS